jgi:hypothetical protein
MAWRDAGGKGETSQQAEYQIFTENKMVVACLDVLKIKKISPNHRSGRLRLKILASN